MKTEIERKFLVVNEKWQRDAKLGQKYVQGYLATNQKCSIRVRLEGEQAYLNIKSTTIGIKRYELEYPLPMEEATWILEKLCPAPLVEKTRHIVTYQEHQWEIDVFVGQNTGLVIAEIELKTENETYALPDWAGEEVSSDIRYYNTYLAKHPYQSWAKKI